MDVGHVREIYGVFGIECSGRNSMIASTYAFSIKTGGFIGIF